MGKKIRRSLIRTWMGANTELGMYVRSSKPGLFLSVHVDDITMTGQEQNMAPMWKKLMKNADPDESTSFHDHVYFGCTQRECKQNETGMERFTKMFGSRISAGATERCTGVGKGSRENRGLIPRHGRTCSKMHWGGTVNWQTRALQWTQYNLVHKFILMLQAMKIPDAKAAVDKGWARDWIFITVGQISNKNSSMVLRYGRTCTVKWKRSVSCFSLTMWQIVHWHSLFLAAVFFDFFILSLSTDRNSSAAQYSSWLVRAMDRTGPRVQFVFAKQEQFKSMLGWSSIQAGRTRISWWIAKSLLTNCLEMLVLDTNRKTRTCCGRSANTQEQSLNRLRHVTDH